MKLVLCILVSFYSALGAADHDSAFAAVPVSQVALDIVKAIKDSSELSQRFAALSTDDKRLEWLNKNYPKNELDDLSQVLLELERANVVSTTEDDAVPAPVPGQIESSPPYSDPQPTPQGDPGGPGFDSPQSRSQDIGNFPDNNFAGPGEPAPGLGDGSVAQAPPGNASRNRFQGPENNPRQPGGGMMGGGPPQDPMSRMMMLAGMAQGFGGQGGGSGGGPPPPLESPKIAPYRPGAPYTQPAPPPEATVTPAMAQSLSFQIESPEQREARAGNFNEFLKNYAQGQTAFLQRIAQQGALYLQNIQGAASTPSNYPALSANVASRVMASVAPRARPPAGLAQGLNLSRGALPRSEVNPSRALLRPRLRYLR